MTTEKKKPEPEDLWAELTRHACPHAGAPKGGPAPARITCEKCVNDAGAARAAVPAAPAALVALLSFFCLVGALATLSWVLG